LTFLSTVDYNSFKTIVKEVFMGSIAEILKFSDEVCKKLRNCRSGIAVEEVFASYPMIETAEDKIQLLRTSMGVKNVYASPDEVSSEQEYRDDIAFFDEGSWRLMR
jgi:hypothetical protein